MEYMKDPGWQYLRQTNEQRLADQSKPFDSKKACWIPDPEDGYISGEIKSTKGDMVTVATEKGAELNLKKELLQEMNPPKFEKTEDMSTLSLLNDASILNNLRARYGSMLIYTYSGLFCVVINPYKRLPIYTDSVSRIYMGKRRNEVPPHLWSVSDEAYRNMLQDRANQSMLITGESGAGKTENTKKVIAYFALVGAHQQALSDKAKGKAPPIDDGKKKVSLEDQIVQTNPVLEAFGNAKTVRNNNSSRFGKFIRIHFSKDGRVSGCDIEHYLLEKSRVIRQAPGERCYHVFYQIFSGKQPDLRKHLQLDKNDLKYYHFVSQAELTIDGMDDQEEFGLMDEAFDILMFTPEEKINIYELMSSIMHMGEMKFKQRPREEQAEQDGTDEAIACCAMMGIDADEFLKALTKPRVKVGTEWVNKGQNLDQVNWAIGAMAKGIYARVFHFLVSKCNQTLDAKELKRENFIGVLDIAGFEIFDFNSFEQLWINYVNEKLQQFFNHHMFVLEQEEYQREGIQWTFIDFGLDLAACIELIEKPMGVLSMLDEECIVPKATDQTLASKLVDQHLGKHPNFQKPKPPKGKQADAHFSLSHYAGTVRYNVTNWLEKNKDPLNDTCIQVMKNSPKNKLLLTIWGDYTTMEESAKKAKESKGGGGGGKKKGKSGSMQTVSLLYRESLNKLMSMLNTTHPHFIRCIIPNEQKKSGMIEAPLVLNQLTCNGVLEGIRICRKGFPNRLQHEEFGHRYAILAAKEKAGNKEDLKVASDAMMNKIVTSGKMTKEEYRIGVTKVFFKAGVLAKMEDLRDERLSEIMLGLQSAIRWYNGMRDGSIRKQQLAGFTILQNNIRSWCTLRTWPWFKIYGAVKPMLKAGKKNEEAEAMGEKMKELEETLAKEEALRKQLEETNTKLLEEKNNIFVQLEDMKTSQSDAEDRVGKLAAHKSDLEKQMNDLHDSLGSQEDRNADLQRNQKKMQGECENLKKNIQDVEMSLRKEQSEKQSRDHQIRSLQDEMTQQDEVIAKVNKEKKHQEEVNRKLTEDIQAEEDKVNHLNKLKAKLESSLDEMEDNLEREKRNRQDLDKSKRKVEGELKVAHETVDELNRNKQELEASLKKKESELFQCTSKLEDESSLVAKLQRQIKELQSRIAELEEEVEAERQSRAKADRGRQELQRELEELSERLDEAGGATTAQQELNKKRDAEMSKLRRDVEEHSINHETQLAALRKKHNDAVAELGDQLDQVQKQKAKIEKDKSTMQREIDDLHSSIDGESKSKITAEKLAKQYETQMTDLQMKCDDQARQLADFSSVKNRMQNENSDLNRQLEDAESQINAMQRIKSQLTSQLEESKRSAADEQRERQSLGGQIRNYQHECDSLRDQIDEEQEAKAEVLRQVSKANAEVSQWRARFENEGLSKSEEVEEAKRRLQQKVSEMADSLEGANTKIVGLEKMRARLIGELDDAQVDVERANGLSGQLEKKQKGFDKVVDDWKRKCDSISAELDAAQRDCRNMSTEVFKLKNTNDEMNDQLEGVRRENKNLAQEIKDLTDQLGEGGRSVHEMQKMIRRLEMEKDELQQALDEAEALLEVEQSKVMRSQVEVSQIRQEIEKRIHEKEEEFENTRKNHQRAIDSMQASMEAEARGRVDLLRMKKKLESDINELEIALDHANKANSEAMKNIKRHQDSIRELQIQVEDEQRQRSDMRESLNNSEKRCFMLQSEKDELMTSIDAVERSRKQAEHDCADAREQNNELLSQNSSLNGIKRKVEAELQHLHSELDETVNELKASEDRSRKAMADGARMAEELRSEQEHSMHLERTRKGLEQQLKEMQVRVEEAEALALKGGKKTIAKLETRIREVENELDTEQRRHVESVKNTTRSERRTRELQFQIDEDKKAGDHLKDLVDKLQQKIKTYKRQVEEAEELANTNLQKYRTMQHQLEDAEERADTAENSLTRLRAKNRVVAPGLTPSSSSSLVRSASRARQSLDE